MSGTPAEKFDEVLNSWKYKPESLVFHGVTLTPMALASLPFLRTDCEKILLPDYLLSLAERIGAIVVRGLNPIKLVAVATIDDVKGGWELGRNDRMPEAVKNLGLPWWAGNAPIVSIVLDESCNELTAGSWFDGSIVSFKERPDEPWCIFGNSAQIMELLTRYTFAQSINRNSRWDQIATYEPSYLSKYSEVVIKANKISEDARKAILTEFHESEAVCSYFDGSGAVYFEPLKWEPMRHEASIKPLVDFFRERNPDLWDVNKPNYRRILFTSTKVMLRGTAYYENMKTSSPFVRAEQIIRETTDILAQLECVSQAPMSRAEVHKITVAWADQLRNASLQMLSFHRHLAAIKDLSYAADTISREEIETFVYSCISTFYDILLKRRLELVHRIEIEKWAALSTKLLDLSQLAQKHFAALFRKKQLTAKDLKKIIRGWREADHPFENLITAYWAIKSEPDTVAGIGWGGIELPIVAKWLSTRQIKTCIINWSHYKSPQEKPVVFEILKGSAPKDGIKGLTGTVALLDDNSLTGITLEVVRDYALTNGAQKVEIFLTRFSGERRYAQMRMEEHGCIDADFLLQSISGYVGETAYARSWSRKEYPDPLGVFSLSKARILRCIHNNTTVDTFPREGF